LDLINDWLEKFTGCTAAWWVAACQNAVEQSCTKKEGEAHDDADPKKFVSIISDLVGQSLKDDGAFDGNMRQAAVLSLVLALWYARVSHAKCHDPNRPGLIRRKAYTKRLEWVEAMALIPVDERQDSVYFSGQKWDFPFSFGTQDGDFT
jgi:hypothetical protein